MRPKVFISYSRRDFAFAEAVAGTLSEQGSTEPWLDSEKLAPGMDWDSVIEQAIDDAEVLLLIASSAALVSSYVTREWTRAHEDRKNIHICVVEAVTLPAELASYPAHDLRSQFWRRTRAVGDMIASGGSASVAPVRRRNLVPAPVAALLAVSLVITFVLLWAALESWSIYGSLRADGRSSDLDLYSRGILLLEASTFVGVGLTVLMVAAQVPWRRSRGIALSYSFQYSAFCGYLAFPYYFLYRSTYPELAAAYGTQATLVAASLAASAVGGGLMLWSRTLRLIHTP